MNCYNLSFRCKSAVFFLLALAVVFFVPVAIATETVEQLLIKANSHYQQKHYPEAYRYWLQASELGSERATYNIGVLYERGQGVNQNYTEAVKWYQNAIKKKYPSAQRNLGVFYRNGWGVQQDYQQAKRLLFQAASQGDILAAAHLGHIYYQGDGGEQDYGEAEKWLRVAAAAGNVHGQYYLGLMYENGKGLPQDDILAIKWFKLAGQQGIADAQIKVGLCYMTGKAGLEKNKTEALKWLFPAAQSGSHEAEYVLGSYYLGVFGDDSVNKMEAVKWLTLAAQGGLSDAQYMMGAYYLGAFGDPKDFDKAATWLAKSAMNNNRQSMQDLGAMLSKDMLAQSRYSEVRAVFEKWADKDDTSAQIYLARMYDKGQGMKINRVQAYIWYSLALDKMNPPLVEGDDLILTALSGGTSLSYTLVKSDLTSLEEVMPPDELQQAKKQINAFRQAHAGDGK